MSNKSEIPCSFCQNWDASAKSFSCDPYKCQKLTEWLFGHVQMKQTKTKHVAEIPILYIV